jgi:hypothetical protein
VSDYLASGAPSGQVSGAAPDVVYRLSRQYRKPMLTRFVVLVVLTAICVAVRTPILYVVAYVTGPLAAIFGVLCLWQGRFATKVTGRGIEVRGYFNHFLPWDDVRDIEVSGWTAGDLGVDEDYGGQVYASGSVRGSSLRVSRVSPNRMAHLARIKVVRANGHKLRLRAPMVSGWASDPDFTDKARQLDQLVARYAGHAIR